MNVSMHDRGTTELAEVIRRLATEAAASTPHQYVRDAIAKTGGVPVYVDMGGVLLITPNGDVLLYDDESMSVKEPSRSERQFALVKAAQRIPELKELHPRKPRNAVECHVCGARGFVVMISQNFDCGACNGTGWTTPTT